MRLGLDIGTANQYYWGCYFVGFVVMFIFNGFHAKKYGIPTKKAVLFTILSYIIIYVWAYILAWIVNGFTWGHHNAIRVFAWMPLVLLATGKLFKIDWETACDYIAPSTCLVYGIARLGCNFTGCCYGIESKWGIYSSLCDRICFPVQFCQSVSSWIIFGIILYFVKNKRKETRAKLYPLMLIMYGGARFLLDFLSDNEKLFWNISELAIWGVVCVVMGVAWLALIHRKKES